jgi:hypothetical protein
MSLGSRHTVEQCYNLDASRLLCEGHIKDRYSVEHVTLRNHNGRSVWDLYIVFNPQGERIEARIPHTSQIIYLHSTRLNFGGRRWWFSCPDCSRRCRLLHSPNGGRFSCRLCLDLTYRSCQQSHCTYSAFPSHIRSGLAALNRRVKVRWVRKRDRRESYKPRGWWLLRMWGLPMAEAVREAQFYREVRQRIDRDWLIKG